MIDIIILAIVSILSFVLGISGLIKPKWTLMWGEKTRKKILFTYLPICLVTLFLLGTTIEAKGETNKRTNDVSQEELLNKKKESIRDLELELDKLAKNYEYYQVTSELLLEQTNWFNEKLDPYFEDIEAIKNITDKAKYLSKLEMVKKVSEVSPIGDLSATISEIITNIKELNEFLELSKKLNSSINKIITLRDEYDKTKNIVVLHEINKELTTNYIYLIGDLEKLTNESIDTFDTFATLIYQKQNIKMVVSDAIDVVKIWDNSEKQASEEENTLEQLKENKKNIENAPEEIQKRMKLDYEYILKIQSEIEVIIAFNEILSKN
ncbi:hypothetical protein ACN6MT_19485 [Neobacillus niacini]|uniref:hypothetical protein n=1 Tax=Neobacillus niacini TaxID=86668 RepID=UPI003B0213C9